jgi:hypothetical protein
VNKKLKLLKWFLRRLQLKRLITFFSIGSLLLISACGGSSSSSVPTTATPSTTPTTVTVPTVTSNPALPNLTNAVSINLVDKTNYSGLAAISGNIYPPLVGDPYLSMTLTYGRTTPIAGTILVAYEDSIGFWGAQVNSFPGVDTYTATSFDMTFADDDLVFRSVGTLTNGSLTGNIYYRLRQSTDTGTECKTVTVSNGSYYDNVTPCVNYMNLSNAQVTNLGSFVQPTFSAWATASGN